MKLIKYTPTWSIFIGFIQQAFVAASVWFAIDLTKILSENLSINNFSSTSNILLIFLFILLAYIIGLFNTILLKIYEMKFWEKYINKQISSHENRNVNVLTMSDKINTESRDIINKFIEEVSDTWQMVLNVVFTLIVIGGALGLKIVLILILSISSGIMTSIIFSGITKKFAVIFSHERIKVASLIRNMLAKGDIFRSSDLRKWLNANIGLEAAQAIPGIIMMVVFLVLLQILFLNFGSSFHADILVLTVAAPRIIQVLSFGREIFEKRAKFIELTFRYSSINT